MRNVSFMTPVAMVVLLQLNMSRPVRAGGASAALPPLITAHAADWTVTDEPSAGLTSKPSVSIVKLPNGVVGRSYLAVLEASAGKSPTRGG